MQTTIKTGTLEKYRDRSRMLQSRKPVTNNRLYSTAKTEPAMKGPNYNFYSDAWITTGFVFVALLLILRLILLTIELI